MCVGTLLLDSCQLDCKKLTNWTISAAGRVKMQNPAEAGFCGGAVLVLCWCVRCCLCCLLVREGQCPGCQGLPSDTGANRRVLIASRDSRTSTRMVAT